MTEKNPLDSVLFITLPENFKIPNGAFPIDVTIPIPVQRSDNQNSQETFDISKLSWEMIIAGMLLILAYDKNNKNIQYYRSLVKAVKPDIKKELTEAAILKSKNEDFDIAEEIFSALRGLEPEDPITMVNSALFYDERGSSYRRSSLNEDADACDDLANTYYTQAMLLEPPVPNAFFNAGFFYLKQRNFKRAKEVFETYCSLISSLSECELPENEKYKIKRAKEVIADISTRNLEDELFKTAYELISNGEEEKGLTSIKAFLEKNPTVWNAWFMLGWALRRLGRWEDAKASFLQTIKCGGENPDTLNELSICLIELKEFLEAKKVLLKALEIEPENTKVMSNLGVLALKMGNESEARSFFVSVLEFDPEDIIAKQALQNLELES